MRAATIFMAMARGQGGQRPVRPPPALPGAGALRLAGKGDGEREGNESVINAEIVSKVPSLLERGRYFPNGDHGIQPI